MPERTLTIPRLSPRHNIWVPFWIRAPDSPTYMATRGELDTGNDHTCIQREVVEGLGYRISGRPIGVNGVTGTASAVIMSLPVRFEMDHPPHVECDSWDFVVVNDMKCECLLGRDLLDYFDLELRRDGTAILKR